MSTENVTKQPRDPAGILGRTVAGRYKITQCIGIGGMGVVYLADQVTLDRSVVLKVVKRDFGADEDETHERFEREARLLSRLEHPNIVSIFDFGIDGEVGISYIVMEFVQGVTLRRFLKKVESIPLSAFVPLAREILKAVACAHAVNLVHRDLKPSNIMVVKRRGEVGHRVKVLDFGLSKLISGGQKLTRPDQVLGSALYMAPETIRGEEVDTRADVYALGALFYRMLSGRAHVESKGDDTLSLMFQQVHGNLVPLVDSLPAGRAIPGDLCELIDECLSKDPSDRPQSAGELLRLLQISVGEASDITAPLALGEVTAGVGHPGMGTPAPNGVSAGSLAPMVVDPVRTTGSHVQSTRGLYFGFAATIGIVFLIVGMGLLGVAYLMSIGQGPVTATTVAAVDTREQDASADLLFRARQIAAIEAMERGEYETALLLVKGALANAEPRRNIDSLLELKGVIETMLEAQKEDSVALAEVEPAEVEQAPDPEPPRIEPVQKAAPKPAPQRRRVKVEPRPEPKPRAEPRPARKTVAITSIPSGLTYAINGEVGQTPAAEKLLPGKYPITLTSGTGETVYAGTFQVGQSGTSTFFQDVTDRLTPEPAPAPAAVPAPVPAAEPTPAPEPASDAALVPVAEPAVPEPVAAAADETPALATGTLVVHSDNVFGEVFVNGRGYGYPPVTVRDVPIGSATIEVRVKGRVRKTKTATVTDGRSSEVRL